MFSLEKIRVYMDFAETVVDFVLFKDNTLVLFRESLDQKFLNVKL